MRRVVLDVDEERLSKKVKAEDIPILLYAPHCAIPGSGVVGNDLRDKITRLGVPPRTVAVDLVTIAMAVTAADTFVLREDAPDGWRRNIHLDVPVVQPEIFSAVTSLLESTLGFLSGDTWRINFRDGGLRPPTRLEVRARLSFADPSKSDCVSLFSGGLDSALGVMDLVQGGRRPLLVSHAPQGDKTYQELVSSRLPTRLQRYSFNAYPSWQGLTEISTRTRSFQFLAVAALVADTLASFRQDGSVDLFICENGLIALNPPLTARRVGALSTRTAHPHYLSMFQKILDELGLLVRVTNPHRHETKGEMLARRADMTGIAEFASGTVSCGNWKRKSQQCGRCLPCLIRRASFHHANVDDRTNYQSKTLSEVLRLDGELRDDVISVHTALRRRYDRNFRTWVLQAGPLPDIANDRSAYFAVAERGMDELEALFQSAGLRV